MLNTVTVRFSPGQGVSAKICNFQSSAKFNALWDLRNVCKEKKKKKKVGADENQHRGHRAQEVWVTFCQINHFKLFAVTARWS